MGPPKQIGLVFGQAHPGFKRCRAGFWLLVRARAARSDATHAQGCLDRPLQIVSDAHETNHRHATIYTQVCIPTNKMITVLQMLVCLQEARCGHIRFEGLQY
jgi:propanediol dehydratase large subunit